MKPSTREWIKKAESDCQRVVQAPRITSRYGLGFCMRNKTLVSGKNIAS